MWCISFFLIFFFCFVLSSCLFTSVAWRNWKKKLPLRFIFNFTFTSSYLTDRLFWKLTIFYAVNLLEINNFSGASVLSLSIWKKLGVGGTYYSHQRITWYFSYFLPRESLSLLTAVIKSHKTSVPLYSIRACIFDIFNKQKSQKWWHTNRFNKMCIHLFECLIPSSPISVYPLDEHTLQSFAASSDPSHVCWTDAMSD